MDYLSSVKSQIYDISVFTFDVPPKGRKILVYFAMSKNFVSGTFMAAHSNPAVVFCEIETVFLYPGYAIHFERHPMF